MNLCSVYLGASFIVRVSYLKLSLRRYLVVMCVVSSQVIIYSICVVSYAVDVLSQLFFHVLILGVVHVLWILN
jgi:hypothetical protein